MFDPLEVIEQEGIALEEWDFAPPIRGIYVAAAALARPVIGLARRLGARPEALRRCVLAEELGHHFTTRGVRVVHFNLAYGARLEVSRAEFRALKWAAARLLPRRELFRALAAGFKEHELAEYFNVTPEMLRFRLRQLAREAAGASDPGLRGARHRLPCPCPEGLWPGRVAEEGGRDGEG